MFEIIYTLIIFGIVGGIIGWSFKWSPQARSTNELARLNKIWEEFNDNTEKELDSMYLLDRVNLMEWRYHIKKVELLKEMIILLCKK